MKLFCFGHSGHSYKVANYLNLAQIPCDKIYVDFFNGEARGADYLALNPMGEAPIFIDGDVTLTQSGVILEYLVDKTGKFAPEDRYENLRWILWDNHKGSAQFGTARFYLNFLPKKYFKEDVAQYWLSRVKAALQTLETALDGREWLVGNSISPADFSCSSYLFYPEEFGFNADEYPAIQAWLERIKSMPNWCHPYDLMPTDQAKINQTPAAKHWHKET